MKNQETNVKAIRQNLYELRRRSRERYLQLMGVNVEKVRELERDIDGKYDELVASLQEQRRQEGKERAERHAKALEISRMALRQDAEKAIHADVSTPSAILDHLGIAMVDPSKLMPFWWCHCHYTQWLHENLGHDDEITIDPTGGSSTATVNYNVGMNQAQPYVRVPGQGTGTINTAELKTWYKFTFTPETSGSYCIRPMAYMNGWWLLWTWGACGGTSEDLGSGEVRVKARVRVDQLSTTVKEIEHTVIDQSQSGGNGSEGAVNYDSNADGGTSMTVYLQGNHEAVIFVECEIYARVSNNGRAIVDMQSGSGFYFWVPFVTIGRRHCHWPWIEVLPLGSAQLIRS